MFCLSCTLYDVYNILVLTPLIISSSKYTQYCPILQDSAMVQMRESLFLEKQKTITTLRDELEQERREIASRAEERYQGQIVDLEAIIKVLEHWSS